MNSKNKGNRFERKIAGFFTKWTGYKFERNRAGSGAWHSNKDSTSDLTCTDERHAHRCKISIECKNYKEIKITLNEHGKYNNYFNYTNNLPIVL